MLTREDAARLRIKARHGELTPEEAAALEEYEAAKSSESGPRYDQGGAPRYANAPVGVANDSGSFGWAVLGFFFPLAGLLLWILWRDGRPMSARRAGKGAIVGAIVGLVLFVLLGVAMMFFAGSAIQQICPGPLNDTIRPEVFEGYIENYEYHGAAILSMLRI